MLEVVLWALVMELEIYGTRSVSFYKILNIQKHEGYT